MKYVRMDHIFSFVDMELSGKYKLALIWLFPGWPFRGPLPRFVYPHPWGSVPSWGLPEKETSENGRKRL